MFRFWDHGSTFGGNYLSATAVSEVIDILNELKSNGTLDETIEYFDAQLHSFSQSIKGYLRKKWVQH